MVRSEPVHDVQAGAVIAELLGSFTEVGQGGMVTQLLRHDFPVRVFPAADELAEAGDVDDPVVPSCGR